MSRASREKQREYSRRWRAANPEKSRAASRNWRESDPDKRRDTARRHYEANLEKAKARRAVGGAIERGDIKREGCLFCNDDKVDGHHHSYASEDWLNVTWLCRRHHKIVHRKV